VTWIEGKEIKEFAFYLHGNFDKSVYRLIKVPVEISHYPPIVDTFWDWVDSDWAGDTDTRR